MTGVTQLNKFILNKVVLIVDIKRARELLGKEGIKYNDKQLQKLIDDIGVFFSSCC